MVPFLIGSDNYFIQMSEETKAESISPTPVSGVPVKFLHQRAGQFRTVHADGVWGAASAYANVHLSFFNERPPMPVSLTQELGPSGLWLAKEPKVEFPTDANVMRQFEVEVIMSVETAKVVRDVLQNFIDLAGQIRQGPQAK